MADSFDWGSLVGPALGAGASLWAGNQNANTAQGALGSQTQGAANAGAALQPYMQVGQNAANLLNNEDITKLPGYQSGLDAGQAAINRKAAATGNYFSGNALKAASKYATDYNTQATQQRQNQLTQLLGQGRAAATQYGADQMGLGNTQAASNISQNNSKMSGIGSALDLASEYLTSKNSSGRSNGSALGSLIGGGLSSLGSGISSLWGNGGSSGYSPTTGADSFNWSGDTPSSDFNDWGFD